ncbi:MAG: type IV toxin-antitoxin system AbiEi family antitoxin domain-containing protein [bacterium]
MYIINKHKVLLSQERKIFHAADLALLWGIENGNTLRTTISRYLKSGILISLHKGLYGTVEPSRLDQLELARAMIHRLSYLTCESVLVSQGVIHQVLGVMTLVGEKSQSFTLPGHNIQVKVRQLAPRFLYNPLGVVSGRADTERATADLMYYNPFYQLDSPSQINQDKLLYYQKELGYK